MAGIPVPRIASATYPKRGAYSLGHKDSFNGDDSRSCCSGRSDFFCKNGEERTQAEESGISADNFKSEQKLAP